MCGRGPGFRYRQAHPHSCGPLKERQKAAKFDLKLGPFYLSGNGVYDDSNECNWVNNGKGDWNIEFDNTGEDLKGALANPACPY